MRRFRAANQSKRIGSVETRTPRANPSNLFLIRQRINEQFRLRNLFSPSRSGLRLGGFRAEVAKIRKRPKK